jgi:hypothetical protein
MEQQPGIPIKEYVDSLIESYKKGFNDAVNVLSSTAETINLEEMKKNLEETIKKHGKIKDKW